MPRTSLVSIYKIFRSLEWLLIVISFDAASYSVSAMRRQSVQHLLALFWPPPPTIMFRLQHVIFAGCQCVANQSATRLVRHIFCCDTKMPVLASSFHIRHFSFPSSSLVKLNRFSFGWHREHSLFSTENQLRKLPVLAVDPRGLKSLHTNIHRVQTTSGKAFVCWTRQSVRRHNSTAAVIDWRR